MTKASSAVQGANAAPVRFRKVGSAEPSFTATIKETQLQEAELWMPRHIAKASPHERTLVCIIS